MKRPLLLLASVLGVAVIAIGALVVVQALRSDDPDLVTEAPAIPTTQPGSTASPSASGTSGVVRFVVQKEGSSAKYVVREKLAALQFPTNAVGETTDVSGEFYLTTQGLAPAPESRFQVDLRTLRSDESRRDAFIRQSTLRTGQFPMAEFVIESLAGFPASYSEGTEVTVTVAGRLTVRGVTKPVTWQVKARKAGETLTAVADTEFKMTDFGIDPPNVSVAKAEDGVHLQMVIVAKQAR